MLERANIITTRKGDIVRFNSYSLRVECEPLIGKGSITLEGRISVDGCPMVVKHFLAGKIVNIERTA